MQKKKLFLITAMLCTTLLTACASNNRGISYLNTSTGMDMVASEDGYYVSKAVTGGDYSSTSISGEYSDYRYTFNATGTTHKSKQDMLDYYESIQDLVDDNGGYISSVDNRYGTNTIRSDSYISESAIKYSAEGSLSFTVEIPNENISLVTDELEKFCRENKFYVTAYNQQITNYKEYTIVDEYSEDDYYRDKVITQKELDKRLKYASLFVNINYNIPRSTSAQLGYGFIKIWDDFRDSFGNIIKIFVFIAIGLVVLFFEAAIFYKAWKKMQYRFRLKKPEYYPVRHIVVHEEGKSNVDLQ